MSLFGSARRRPGWLCINLRPDRVDLSHVLAEGRNRPEVLLCDSYRKEGGDGATLRRLRRELDLDRYRCTTLLPSGQYQLLQVDAPNVPAPEVRAAARWSIKDMIDFPVEAAAVDALHVPASDSHTRQVFVVVARNQAIAAAVKPFNDADIPVEVIDIPELAQRNLARCFEAEGRALALLSFDEDGGLLTFTAAGELYQTRRIELGAGDLDSGDKDDRTQVYDRVVLELQRSLDNFDRQFRAVTAARLIVAPVSGADALQEHLAANLDIPVALMELSGVLDFPNIPELRDPGRQAQCLHLIGAAMRTEATTLT